MKKALLVLLLSLVLPTITCAGEIDLQVVRHGTGLYEIVDKDIFMQTEYCFEGQEKAEVTLTLKADSKTITFKKTGTHCDVIQVYGRNQMEPGEYREKIDRNDEGWYGITGRDVAFRTSGCYSLAEAEDAVITISEDGRSGTLTILAADESCSIEAIYSAAELKIETE